MLFNEDESAAAAAADQPHSPSLLTGKVHVAPTAAVQAMDAVIGDVREVKKLHMGILAMMENHNQALTSILTNNNATNVLMCTGTYI